MFNQSHTVHIMPLVINGLGGGDTHTYTHTRTPMCEPKPFQKTRHAPACSQGTPGLKIKNVSFSSRKIHYEKSPCSNKAGQLCLLNYQWLPIEIKLQPYVAQKWPMADNELYPKWRQKIKVATIVGGLCMEGLWRGWRFAMIGMKKLDEGYALSCNGIACV